MSNIEIIKHKKLDLETPVFLCDGSLNKELERYQMLSNLNGFKMTMLIGRPASGKTSLLISWLTTKKVFKKMYHKVVVVMPSSSRNSMKKNPFKKHLPERLFEELDLSTITTIYNNLLESSEAKETTLLLLDDIGASLKNNEIQKLLRKIIYNKRHLKCHIIMLLQSCLSCPREVRKMCDSVVIFKPSKIEAEVMMNELFEYTKEDTLNIIKYAFTKPHDYLMLNITNQKMYKDYNEIILKNNNLVYDIDSDDSESD